MPSPLHQNLVWLLRERPSVLFELVRRAGAPVADAFDEIDAHPTEFDDPWLEGSTVRADLATVGRLAGKPRQAALGEVQLGRDRQKQWSWPYYRGALRWRLRCPVFLVVLSPDPGVRAWIVAELFEEEPQLRPLLVTPEHVPPVPLETALTEPGWAVLAVVMRGRGPDAAPLATVAVRATLAVAPREYGRYLQIITASVGETIMDEVRDRLSNDELDELSEWERQGSSFVRGRREGLQEGLERGVARGLERGLEQGLEQGLERGLEQGRQRGVTEGLREALFAVVGARGWSLDPAGETRVAGCDAPEQLRAWIVTASSVGSVAELLAALEPS